MSSILKTIETAAVTAVDAVASINAVKAVSVDAIAIKFDEEGRLVLDELQSPDAYPSADIAIDESRIAFQRSAKQGNRATFRVPVMVLLRVVTDGATVDGARWSAWQEGEAITRKLMATVPDLSVHTNTTALAPFEPGPHQQLPTDGNTHGMLMEFSLEYTISVAVA